MQKCRRNKGYTRRNLEEMQKKQIKCRRNREETGKKHRRNRSCHNFCYHSTSGLMSRVCSNQAYDIDNITMTNHTGVMDHAQYMYIWNSKWVTGHVSMRKETTQMHTTVHDIQAKCSRQTVHERYSPADQVALRKAGSLLIAALGGHARLCTVGSCQHICVHTN